MVAAQSRSPGDVRLSVEGNEDQDTKTVKDLWEVIRYLETIIPNFSDDILLYVCIFSSNNILILFSTCKYNILLCKY